MRGKPGIPIIPRKPLGLMRGRGRGGELSISQDIPGPNGIRNKRSAEITVPRIVALAAMRKAK